MENYYLIELKGKNPYASYAKVSLDKIEYVDKYVWYLGKTGYPFTFIDGVRVQLHKYIWLIKTGSWNKLDNANKLYIDHINRDKLDATDENLRLASPAENSYNKTPKEELHHIKKKKNKYCISLCKDGEKYEINDIETLDEAKKTYNIIAKELFGEYAVLYN